MTVLRYIHQNPIKANILKDISKYEWSSYSESLNDEKAKKIIKRLSHCNTATEFQELEIKKRDELLKKLKENGLSIRQISRLTGISKGIVEKTNRDTDHPCLT